MSAPSAPRTASTVPIVASVPLVPAPRAGWIPDTDPGDNPDVKRLWLIPVLGWSVAACGLRALPVDAGGRADHFANEQGSTPDTSVGETMVDTAPALDSTGDADAGSGGEDASDARPLDTNDVTEVAPDAAGTEAGDAGAEAGCSTGANGHAPWASPLFAPPTNVALPDGATGESVAIGDVTGDGLADVVVGTWGVDAIVVYAQHADGSLSFSKSYDDGAMLTLGPKELELADVNGDGRLDVVYTRDVDVAVMLQNASGTLDAPVGLAPTEPGNGEEALAVGDLNGDGRVDVAAAGWGADGIDVWFQDATGALAGAKAFSCPHKGYETLAVGDIDGDGLVDLAVSGEQQQDVCVLLQRTGGFADSMSLPVGSTVGGLGVGRLGLSDCQPDLVVSTGGNRPSGKLGILTPATHPDAGLAASLPSYDIPASLVVADVDGDGRPDVVVVHTGWLSVGVYRQLPSGGLAGEERYDFPYLNWGPDRIAVGDINGDGRPDVVGVDDMLGILLHK